MVAIKPETIAKLKNYATTQFNKRVANPQEGTIFDACNKLGIKNTDDLKAGFELFKENPTEAIGTAYKDLQEKGFKLNTDYNRKHGYINNNNQKNNVQNNVNTQTAQNTEATETDEAVETAETAENEGEKIPNAWADLAKKLGITNTKDLKAALAKLKENPNETAQSAVSKLGGSEELAQKAGKLAAKFFA